MPDVTKKLKSLLVMFGEGEPLNSLVGSLREATRESLAEIERLQCDSRRLAYLAGCGSDDGPAFDSIGDAKEDFYDHLLHVATVGQATDDDKLEAMRRLIDDAMEQESKHD